MGFRVEKQLLPKIQRIAPYADESNRSPVQHSIRHEFGMANRTVDDQGDEYVLRGDTDEPVDLVQ